MGYIVRQARTRDVPVIRALIDQNVGSGRLLDKPTVNLYEDVLEFTVAESSDNGAVVGCGALHVLWEDLAELRTVAVDEGSRGGGIGHLIVDGLLDRARQVGVSRVFVLTFAVQFFASHGFAEISGTPVAPEVYAELLRSYDDGVAEFLDLDRVKPNTLGNTRMLLRLLAPGAAGRVPGMLQDLAALAPPAIVCAAFAVGAWVVVRRELAPKRRKRAEDEALSDGERSADGELGRSLYFTTSAIYRDALSEYAAKPQGRDAARSSRRQARRGDLLTVRQLADYVT
jgi:amino-acid N-acetyltransferase